MKRKSRTNKRIGKRTSKRNSKKVYKKRNLKSLRKTRRSNRSKIVTKRRAFKGGLNEENTQIKKKLESELQFPIQHAEDDEHNFSVGSLGTSVDDTMHTDELNISQTSESGDTTLPDDGLSFSNITHSLGNMGHSDLTDSTSETNATAGGKRRRGKKGGELPFDYNPNDRDPDAYHN
jgi:hypothetical protein